MAPATPRYSRGFPHGLMFHRFRSSEAEAGWQGALSPGEFEAVLLHVGVDNILSPDAWLDRLATGRLEARHLCVTFDDGLRCQMTEALPVLERHGLRAFWFVYSCVFDGVPVQSEVYSYAATRMGGMPRFIVHFLARCPPDLLVSLESPEFAAYAAELRRTLPFYSDDDMRYRFLRNRETGTGRFDEVMAAVLREAGVDIAAIGRQLWMSPQDVASLTAAGHAVGLHSYDHPYDMAGLPVDSQRNQYARNCDDLEAACGRRPVSVAHPLGSYSSATLRVLADLGVTCGFRANTAPAPGGARNPGPLELAREDATILLAAARAASQTAAAPTS